MVNVVVGSIYKDTLGREHKVMAMAYDTETAEESWVLRSTGGCGQYALGTELALAGHGFECVRTEPAVEFVVGTPVEGIEVGGLYRHFKGNDYRVLCVATAVETDEAVVVYEALYGEHLIWARPLEMFLDKVTRDGETFNRFTAVSE